MDDFSDNSVTTSPDKVTEKRKQIEMGCYKISPQGLKNLSEHIKQFIAHAVSTASTKASFLHVLQATLTTFIQACLSFAQGTACCKHSVHKRVGIGLAS